MKCTLAIQNSEMALSESTYTTAFAGIWSNSVLYVIIKWRPICALETNYNSIFVVVRSVVRCLPFV